MFVHRKGIKDIYQVMSEDAACTIIKAMFMVRSPHISAIHIWIRVKESVAGQGQIFLFCLLIHTGRIDASMFI